MKLVPDAGDWWKWYSTHGLALGALFNTAAAAVAASTSAGALYGIVPVWMVFGLAACIFVGTFAGRLIDQAPTVKEATS